MASMDFEFEGQYLVRVKDVVRKSAGIEVGQVLGVGLNVGRRYAPDESRALARSYARTSVSSRA